MPIVEVLVSFQGDTKILVRFLGRVPAHGRPSASGHLLTLDPEAGS